MIGEFLQCLFIIEKITNPFVPNSPFLYRLKTSENLTVFWCFQGVEKGCKPDDYATIKRRIKREVLNFRITLWLNFFINAEKITVALPFKIFKANSHTESDHFSFTSFNQRFSPTAFSNFLHWTLKHKVLCFDYFTKSFSCYFWNNIAVLSAL